MYQETRSTPRRQTLAALKHRIAPGVILYCVENTFRPAMNNTVRIVTAVQRNGFYWVFRGSTQRCWTTYPAVSRYNPVDTNTFDFYIDHIHYVRLRFMTGSAQQESDMLCPQEPLESDDTPMASWAQKAHMLIAAMSYAAYYAVNINKKETQKHGHDVFYKKHRPYGIPVMAVRLLQSLEAQDEAQAQALFLQLASVPD